MAFRSYQNLKHDVNKISNYTVFSGRIFGYLSSATHADDNKNKNNDDKSSDLLLLPLLLFLIILYKNKDKKMCLLNKVKNMF